MKLEILSIVLFALVLVTCSKPHEPGKHERAYDHDLSDVDHNEDGEDHDTRYDHEAILGKDEAKKFDELTPEESKARLSALVDKMDKDSDGRVSSEELRKWISDTSRRYLFEDRDRQWKEYTTEASDKITWEEYKSKSYGDADTGDDMNSMKTRDERRWKMADKNGDGSLDKDEFLDFLHPEEAPHMKGVVIQDALDSVDKDKDGFISLQEYLSIGATVIRAEADMYNDRETAEKDRIPRFVKHEIAQFRKKLDKDGDGRLSQPEIHDWLIPNEYERSLTEALYLFKLADLDQDGYLTKDEILNKYDTFVGSQATDFGEALTRHEDL